MGYTPASLARWMAERPARLAGLAGRKGVIAPGADADLVVWDPDAQWTVHGSELQHRHPLTPYEGRTLLGVVRATFVRGGKVFERGEGAREPGVFPGTPCGDLIAAGAMRPVDRARGSG